MVDHLRDRQVVLLALHRKTFFAFQAKKFGLVLLRVVGLVGLAGSAESVDAYYIQAVKQIVVVVAAKQADDDAIAVVEVYAGAWRIANVSSNHCVSLNANLSRECLKTGADGMVVYLLL